MAKFKDYDNRYLHRFHKLNCAPLLLEQKVFPNIKEITESYGAFEAINTHLVNEGVLDRKDINTAAIVVGDGSTPRTAALLCCLTNWEVHSVDHAMKLRNWKFDRLFVYPKKIEEMEFNAFGKRLVVIAVHSHASALESLRCIFGAVDIHFVNIPCCFEHELPQEPTVEYVDKGIQSEKQTVQIWPYAQKMLKRERLLVEV